MKVLFVAVFDRKSTNVSQADGLRRNGCKVIKFDYRNEQKKTSKEDMNALLRNTCIEEKPDLMIISKGDSVTKETIECCNKYTKTCMWYMDPMNNFKKSLQDKIRVCTFTCCALHDPYQAAKQLSQHVYFIHEGFDHIYNRVVSPDYKYNVTFIGHLREHRWDYADVINHIYKNAYGEQHAMAVGESRINLNFTHGGCSDRVYKVLASKGFLLTEPWPEMDRDFIVGEDLDIFHDKNELIVKARYYLTNEDERLRIAEHGYQTVQKFSRIEWAKRILEIAKCI